MSAYMSIHCDVLDSVKEDGFKKTIEETGEDEHQNEATFSQGQIETDIEEIDFNERTGCLSFSSTIKVKKNNSSTDIGYFSDEIEIDLETASNIVNYFMKKMGKLKTVLEATKE